VNNYTKGNGICAKYNLNEEGKEDVMGRECRTHGAPSNAYENLVRKRPIDLRYWRYRHINRTVTGKYQHNKPENSRRYRDINRYYLEVPT
jgi:hypothetical protein